MKDQVDALVNLGVKAASLDSTVDMERSTVIRHGIMSGQLKVCLGIITYYFYLTKTV
jgi:superfamily II DNA helicase RecQ